MIKGMGFRLHKVVQLECSWCVLIVSEHLSPNLRAIPAWGADPPPRINSRANPDGRREKQPSAPTPPPWSLLWPYMYIVAGKQIPRHWKAGPIRCTAFEYVTSVSTSDQTSRLSDMYVDFIAVALFLRSYRNKPRLSLIMVDNAERTPSLRRDGCEGAPITVASGLALASLLH